MDRCDVSLDGKQATTPALRGAIGARTSGPLSARLKTSAGRTWEGPAHLAARPARRIRAWSTSLQGSSPNIPRRMEAPSTAEMAALRRRSGLPYDP